MRKSCICISLATILCFTSVFDLWAGNSKKAPPKDEWKEEETNQEQLKKDFENNLQLAQKGDSEAQNELAIIYAEGLGVKRDDKEAIKWFFKSAEQGNANAACNLALHYARGEGVGKDIVQALMWSYISNSLDGLRCGPIIDSLDYFKPAKSKKEKAAQSAMEWLRNHPAFTNEFGEKPWMDDNYIIRNRTIRF
jgi:TPR repeat protein